jgi:hypothetical protein
VGQGRPPDQGASVGVESGVMADQAADTFDPGAVALTPQTLAELAEARKQAQLKRVRPARPEPFVKLPYERTLAAAGRLGNAPLAVLVELAYQAFKTHRTVVPLANAALRSVGVSRLAKLRALRQLEASGLVAVGRRGKGRSPLVTLLWR